MTLPEGDINHNGIRRAPSRDILSGESADVYFARAEEILARSGAEQSSLQLGC